MAIVNKLISCIENSRVGSSIKQTLKSGTKVEVIKKTENSINVIRRKVYGDVFTTEMQNVNGKYIPTKVQEEYIFGLVNIEFKKNGSRHVQIKACDYKGRTTKGNNGFFKTTQDKIVFPKGAIIQSLEKALNLKKSERTASIEFLSKLKTIRKNHRCHLPEKNYNVRQDFMYEDAIKNPSLPNK